MKNLLEVDWKYTKSTDQLKYTSTEPLEAIAPLETHVIPAGTEIILYYDIDHFFYAQWAKYPRGLLLRVRIYDLKTRKGSKL